MNESGSTLKIQIPCKYLRSNSMYYNDPGQEDDEYSSGIYWCTKTHESFGPDDEPVSKTDCCNGRSCHVV